MVALRWLGRLALNVLLILDMAGNCVLLGRPGETISHRCARLRLNGGRWAPTGCVLCRCLTGMFFFMRRDHCTWALDGQDSVASELWRWSK